MYVQVLSAAERTPDQPWRLPRHREDAGAARQPRLHKVPHHGQEAAGESRQVSGLQMSLC